MAKRKSSIEEVEVFLGKVKNLADDNLRVRINDEPWMGKANKTQLFMAETGIKRKDIREMVKELKICHYSYTDDDYNPEYKNEEVWVFGMKKNIVDKDEELYIKLKIRGSFLEILKVMSFHREEAPSPEEKLIFPYKEK